MKLPFVMGTAQFGSDYGITNTHGQPTLEKVRHILQAAINEQIFCFDTAFSYGKSMEYLLQFVGEHRDQAFKIISKFSVLDDYDKVAKILEVFLQKSSLPNFYALLIHDPSNVAKIDIKKLKFFLEKLKNSGIAYKIGVSVYSPEEFQEFVTIIPIDIVQFPANLFDQRFLSEEFSQFCKNNRIETHARSLFLQGVLLAKQLPAQLEEFLGIKWALYQAILKKQSMSSLNAIMSWIKSIDFIDQWLIGVNTVKEFHEIIQAYKLSTELCFDPLFLHDPTDLMIDPRNWKLK